MNNPTRSPKWALMITAVYNSIGSGDHDPANDRTTRNVMDRIVSWLCAGKELSPGLQKALVKNINQRTHYKVLDPDSPIRFTRHQLSQARKTNPEWFGLEPEADGELDLLLAQDGAERSHLSAIVPADRQYLSADVDSIEHAYQQSISALSATYQQSISTLSAPYQQMALTLLQDLVSRTAQLGVLGATSCSPENPKVKERKGKQSNHDEDISFASRSLSHEGSPDGSPTQVFSIIPDAMSPEVVPFRSQPQDSTAPAPVHESVVDLAGRAAKPAPASGWPDCVTVWTKNAASGFLEMGGAKYALNFTTVDNALALLGSSYANNPWLDFVQDTFHPTIAAAEAAATGLAASCTVSPLYEEFDTKGKQAPAAPYALVMLDWVDGSPVRAFLLDGEDLTTFDMVRKSADRFVGQKSMGA